MMTTPKWAWLRGLLGGAVLAGAAVSVATLATASPGVIRPVGGCALFTPAADLAESHEVFDPNTGILQIDTGEATFVIDPDDPACAVNARAQRRLDNARLVENETRVGQCAGFREAVAERRAVDKGTPVDLAAAGRYLDEEC